MTRKSQREPTGFVPAGLLRPQGKVLVPEIRAPWRHLFDFLLFYLFFAPCLSSCFVAISGFEAQLGPEVPLQKLLPYFFLVISRQNYCFPHGEEVLNVVPCSRRVQRFKGGSFSPGPSAAGWPRCVISAGTAERWSPVQGGRDSHQLFSLPFKTKLQAMWLLQTKTKIM